MRKIISKRELEKKQKRNQLIVGIILVVMMFSSVIGYSFAGRDTTNSGSTSEVNYNGYKFINQNNFWVVEKDGNNLIFRYSPNQVPTITNKINNIDSYLQKPLYLYSEDPTSSAEISVNMAPYVLRMQTACIGEENCPYIDAPIKTCEDNFIIIKKANETNIIQKDGCVYISAPAERLVQLTDGFLFKVLL